MGRVVKRGRLRLCQSFGLRLWKRRRDQGNHLLYSLWLYFALCERNSSLTSHLLLNYNHRASAIFLRWPMVPIKQSLRLLFCWQLHFGYIQNRSFTFLFWSFLWRTNALRSFGLTSGNHFLLSFDWSQFVLRRVGLWLNIVLPYLMSPLFE